jgi:hypothetical protein
MLNSELNLQQFIAGERAYFEGLSPGITWEEDKWDARQWLFHRGSDTSLLFRSLSARVKLLPEAAVTSPPPGPLPAPFSDFVKALAVYLYRVNRIGYMAIRNYVAECRRLHIFMNARGETSPAALTRWHFETVIVFLRTSGYKNLYDSSANLKVISDLLDKLQLTPWPVGYTAITTTRSYFDSSRKKDPMNAEERTGEEKLPSYEAMQAYARCSNQPISDTEEILLRTIDLLIAMGQRGNEVTLIPLECWVEKPVTDTTGIPLSDAHGNAITQKGIRYYAEKNFQSRIHWLAEQDIPFARRAVGRLQELTRKARAVAEWQEQNPGKLWPLAPEEIVQDCKLLHYLGFSHAANLHLYLNRNGIKPVYINKEIRNPLPRNRSVAAHFYRAGDIEQLLLPKLSDHVALREKVNNQWKALLRTSEVLSIRFEGAYRFKERNANIFTVYPGRTELKEINAALGAVPGMESVFDRRNLVEADGSRIVLTSHQPRHWRNTLYELAGMSNVQQALAMGRRRLDQNPTYQHTTLSERTATHQDFTAFAHPEEKISFLHSGIRTGKIHGEIADTYHQLATEKGKEKADAFLNTHALAVHITPFGGCTHDFSQAPCTKHLQGWNGCSHLVRTHMPGETERISEQLRQSELVLEKMKSDSDSAYGSDKWIRDLEKKIENLRKALAMAGQDSPTPVFPDGIPATLPGHIKKGSSVK